MLDHETIQGLIAGLIQTIVGHPFDTIKVWHQSNYPIKLANFTPKRLYYGVTAPLISSGIFNSVIFGCSHLIHEHIKNLPCSWFISGASAGIVGSIVLNPLDVWKIQRQRNTENIWRDFQPGRGMIGTLSREPIAMGIYLSTYHYLREQQRWNSLTAGAITGVITWLTTYPLDVIKTRVQSNYSLNYRDAISKEKLWRGLPIVLARAAIVNGISFSVYEQTGIFLKVEH